jgi:hypothetical protein
MFGEGENMLINPDEDTSINRFILNEYREMKVENRQLIAENAILKQKLMEKEKENVKDKDKGELGENPVV